MDTVEFDQTSALIHASLTDIGMRRANNQDSHAVVLAADDAAWRQRGHLFMVADGMGAHAAGELASRLATDNVPHLYQHHRELPIPEALERAIAGTNFEIHRRGQVNPDFHNMGTTASVLVLAPIGAVVGHVGDSRVYRLRGNVIEQLTFDHSLQWELRSAGVLAGSDAEQRIPKNVITRSLGPNPFVSVDVEGPFPLELGDTFLLCSDGLTGQVKDDEIGLILAHLSPAEGVRVLVDLANLRGGPDNITIIVARVANPALVTVESADPPPTASTKREYGRGMLPAWIAMGVCLFLALILWSAQLTLAGVLFAVAGVLAGGVGVTLPLLGRLKSSTAGGRGRAERQGPYVRTACKPDGFVRTLVETLDELHAASREVGGDVDWQEVERRRRAAQNAASHGDQAGAIRGYSLAISFLMGDLRRQRNGDSDAGRVDY